MPSTICPPSIASAAVNAPPSSSSTIAVSCSAIARAAGLVGDRARGRAHLVGGPEVDPVVLAVARNRRQVDDARAEHDRQPAAGERSQQRAHPADAGVGARLVGPHQHHLGQLALSDVGGRHQREAVAARTVDQVVGPVARQRVEQWGAVLAQRAGLEHLLDDRLAVLEHAQVKRDRSRVDAGYPGHIIRA